MKHSIFKYVRNIAVASVAGFALLLASCSNVETDEVASLAKDGQKVAVRIALAETARSAFPEIARDDFDTLALECDGELVETWANDVEANLTAYQMMAMSVVELTAGEHAFVLTGTVGGSSYKGSVTQTITEDSVLSFTLSASSFGGAGDGTFTMYMKFPTNVNAAKLSLYPTQDGKTYDTSNPKKNYTFSLSNTTTENGITYKYLNTTIYNCSAGLYVVVLTFYTDTSYSVPLGTWEEVVGIVKNKTTSLNKTLTMLNKTYTITYHLNGGKIGSSTEYTQQYSSLIDVTLATPTKENLDFGGWYEAEDCSGKATEDWTARTRVGDLDLYAKWNYTVTFDANAPEGETIEGTTASAVGHEGNAITLTKNAFTREGYVFDGWNTVASPTEETPGTKYEDCDISFVATAHTTLYAQWKAREADKVAVTFRANGGTLVDSQQVASGAALTVPTTSRTGYDLIGWFTAENFDETTKVDFTTYAPTEDATLYAKWTAQEYSITYKDAGTTATDFSGTHADGYAQKHTYGAKTTLDEPTKADHTFTGWHLAEDGTDAAIKTLAADGYLANITLYATWERTVYYASATGNDTTGTGDAEAPYATVAQAVTTIKEIGTGIDYTIAVDGMLTECVTIDTELTVDKAKTLTIRGKTGKATDKLDGNESGTVLTLTTAVPITLADITITGGSTSTSYTGAGITLNNSNALLTLADGALIADNENTANVYYAGGGVFVYRGTLTLEDGATISGNTTCNGGGVSVYYGAVVMNGGTITANTATESGGGVYINSGTFTMDGGTIANNTASNYWGGSGGGVYNSRTFIMNGGTITKNTAEATNTSSSASVSGGGVYNDSTFRMTGGTISGNTLVSPKGNTYGGAVYQYGSFYMSGNAYIPAGDDGKNDVCLANWSYYIRVSDTLTATAPVATIRPPYTDGAYLLSASDTALLADAKDQFAYALDETPWNIVVEDEYVMLYRPDYKITYLEQGGGEFKEELSVTDATYHKFGSETTLPVPTKEGSIFLGWYFEEDCSGTRIKTLGATDCTADITLYAAWAKEQVTVEVVSGDISIATTEDEENGTITFTPAQGFTDCAWTIGGTAATDVIEGAKVSATDSSLTFAKAKLTGGRTYVVTLTAKNANGKTFMSVISIKK